MYWLLLDCFNIIIIKSTWLLSACTEGLPGRPAWLAPLHSNFKWWNFDPVRYTCSIIQGGPEKSCVWRNFTISKKILIIIDCELWGSILSCVKINYFLIIKNSEDLWLKSVDVNKKYGIYAVSLKSALYLLFIPTDF